MWKIYSNYKDIWPSCLEDIKNAKESIKFENYILVNLESGDIGEKFIEALIEKASTGVKVELIIDAVGSHELYFSHNVRILETAGVDITFHTTTRHRFRNIFKSFFRDHRKLLIVDDRIAHIGGYIVKGEAQDWGELDVRFEKSGTERDVVSNLVFAFDYARQSLKESNMYMTPKPRKDKSGFSTLGSSPHRSEHYILKEIKKNIRAAQNSIKVVSPYFVPTYKLLKEILRARKRGVKIEIILPVEIDNIVAKYTSHIFYNLILRRGIVVCLFSMYSHAKMIIVDDKWSIFGSANLDRLSHLHNYELSVSSENQEFNKDLITCFESYMARCHRLTLEEWKTRPIWRKFLEKLAILLLPIA